MLVEPRHDLDEIARAVAVIELVHEDLVPGVAADLSSASSRVSETVSTANCSGTNGLVASIPAMEAPSPSPRFTLRGYPPANRRRKPQTRAHEPRAASPRTCCSSRPSPAGS